MCIIQILEIILKYKQTPLLRAKRSDKLYNEIFTYKIENFTLLYFVIYFFIYFGVHTTYTRLLQVN